jgi:hypothetical protein
MPNDGINIYMSLIDKVSSLWTASEKDEGVQQGYGRNEGDAGPMDRMEDLA